MNESFELIRYSNKNQQVVFGEKWSTSDTTDEHIIDAKVDHADPCNGQRFGTNISGTDGPPAMAETGHSRHRDGRHKCCGAGQSGEMVAPSTSTQNKGQGQRLKLRPPILATRMALLKRWLLLELFHLSLLIQLPILETNCDDSNPSLSLSSFDGSSSSSFIDSSASDQLTSTLSQYQARAADQLAQIQHQHNQRQSDDLSISQLQAPTSTSNDEFSTEAHQFLLSSMANQVHGDNPAQQYQQQGRFLEDLLESQSKAATTSNTESSISAKANSPSMASSSSSSSSGDKQGGSESGINTGSASSSGGSASPTPSVGSLLTDQLNAVTSLLQQIGAQQTGAISEAVASGVANSIIRPALAATSNTANFITSGNRVQKPNGFNGANGNVNSRPISVGQSIDGNIEYDSNNNAINGFIEIPNFGLNSSSKPSLSSVKPFILAALKTVPIKLGSVGWKLLQLIAWKKIYKTHHPKSGEIVIEEEMKTGPKKSMGKSFGGSKSMDLGDMGGHKMSMGGGLKGGSMGGYSKSMGGFGGHPMMHTFSAGAWPMGLDGSPHMSASMAYQRHLLPPTHLAAQSSGAHHHQSSPSSSSSSSSSHPATAAAAAAAATAAAIQSQWVQSQLADAEFNERELLRSAPTNQSQPATASGMSQSVLHRKRASLSNGNWFAAPAHAYAAAAAAANAASMAAAASQQRHFGRLSGHANHFDVLSGESGLRDALTGLMYQNLFDNAAAMAVQSAVKLPAADYLDQADSLSGSSLSSLGVGSSLSDGASGLESAMGWAGADAGPLGRADLDDSPSPPPHTTSDSLLVLNEPASSGPSSMAGAIPDFDDTPAGKLLGAALNGSHSGHFADARRSQRRQHSLDFAARTSESY